MALSINKRSRLAEDDPEYQSKTQAKKELDDLKGLGKLLCELPEKQYQSLDLPDKLDDAVQTFKRIKSNIAQKRQMQFIGKLLRDIDIEPIKQVIDEWQNGRKGLTRELKKLETLRDKLIEGDKDALESIIKEHPQCDIQKLRSLIRLAQKEKKLEKPPTYFRKLFQELKLIHQEK